MKVDSKVELDLSAAQRELARLIGLLERSTDKLEQTARAFVDAKADHKIAFAKAILSSEGTVVERESRAVVATDTLFRQAMLAEELHRVQRDRVMSIREAMQAVRTLESSRRVADTL